MQDLPHHYTVSARAAEDGDVTLESPGLPSLASAPPTEFDGPGDRWSPETLLLGAVADCFVLTFRAVAQASRLDWQGLAVEVEGTLDRVERAMQFTELRVHATLRVGPEVDEARAQRALERSEKACLITNSLKASSRLATKIEVGAGD